MKSVRHLARTLAPHARIGRLAEYLNNMPSGRVATVGTIAAELGEEADWIGTTLRNWCETGWVIREPVEFGMFGYKAGQTMPIVGDLEDMDEAALWATVLSAAITLDRVARRA